MTVRRQQEPGTRPSRTEEVAQRRDDPKTPQQQDVVQDVVPRATDKSNPHNTTPEKKIVKYPLCGFDITRDGQL